MNRPPQGISFVLPALNEERNIESLTHEIIEYCSAKELPFEIIIVNDGSTDTTGSIADALAAQYKTVRPIHHVRNQGYGKSLRDGFAAGRYEYLFFTDADRQFRIGSLDGFLPWMEGGKADLVIGYRIDRKDTPRRRFLAWCFNRLARILFSIRYRDIDCAFKLIKNTVFRTLQMTSDGFLFNTELLAKAQIKRCTSVQLGVEHFPRAGGISTVSFRHMRQTMQRLFVLYGEIRTFKRRETLEKPHPGTA
jgi:glycosyltransferase involved in cell wall biosynthesis